FKDALKIKYTNQRSNLNTLNREPEDIVQLIRVGSPLLTNIHREYRWDDRGTSFATWRQDKSFSGPEWMGFKLCYLVSSDTVLQVPEEEQDFTTEEETAFLSRLNSYLMAWTEVIYLDDQLNVVEDPTNLPLLSKPYNTSGGDYLDKNLGNKREALFKFIDKDLFKERCYSIREESERWLREQPNFINKINNFSRNGKIDISKRIKRLRQRQKNASRKIKLELEREIYMNNLIIEVIEKPGIRLDSIGVIILSSQGIQEFIES
ncbi:uncharacterized protein METZ01_LOCUS417327, partial [marine metagenome]